MSSPWFGAVGAQRLADFQSFVRVLRAALAADVDVVPASTRPASAATVLSSKAERLAAAAAAADSGAASSGGADAGAAGLAPADDDVLLVLTPQQRRLENFLNAQRDPHVVAAGSSRGTTEVSTSTTLRNMAVAHYNIAVICTVFFMYTPTVTAVLQLFSCITVDATPQLNPLPSSPLAGTWLTTDATQRCFVGAHGRYVLYLGVPGVVLVAAGVPLAVLLIVRSHASSLRDRHTVERFGFLYWGFRREAAWWEAVILLRKLVVVLITVFIDSANRRFAGSTSGSELRMLLVLLALIVALLLQDGMRPYSEHTMANLEVLSISGSAAVAFAGAFLQLLQGARRRSRRNRALRHCLTTQRRPLGAQAVRKHASW